MYIYLMNVSCMSIYRFISNYTYLFLGALEATMELKLSLDCEDP